MLDIINIDKLDSIEKITFDNILKDLMNGYIDKFDLSNFKGIEFINDDYLQNEYSTSEGRTENEKILLPYSKVKNALKNTSSDEYKDLKSTILHELSHINLRNKLPILHNLYDNLAKEERYDEASPIQIWIEYNAQKESEKIKVGSIIKKYHQSICDYNWNLYNEIHFVLLKKHLPYIIVRLNSEFLDKDDALSKIRNEEVRKIILDVERILKKLSSKPYEDSYVFLKELSDYLKSLQIKYNY